MRDVQLKALVQSDVIAARIFVDTMAQFIQLFLQKAAYQQQRCSSEKKQIEEAAQWSIIKRRDNWQALVRRIDESLRPCPLDLQRLLKGSFDLRIVTGANRLRFAPQRLSKRRGRHLEGRFIADVDRKTRHVAIPLADLPQTCDFLLQLLGRGRDCKIWRVVDCQAKLLGKLNNRIAVAELSFGTARQEATRPPQTKITHLTEIVPETARRPRGHALMLPPESLGPREEPRLPIERQAQSLPPGLRTFRDYGRRPDDERAAFTVTGPSLLCHQFHR